MKDACEDGGGGDGGGGGGSGGVREAEDGAPAVAIRTEFEGVVGDALNHDVVLS